MLSDVALLTRDTEDTSVQRVAIEVEQLSKCYQIFDRPRDRLRQLLAVSGKKYYREHWALRDVSFKLYRGETVGIIGRNGAGKSTLLQLITGTVTPTSGSVTVHGRVAALLELGSGINPEFTGRENIGLLSAILGLSAEEAKAREPEIIAFADLGEFIDQPVKIYSSGMYVRLGFAIATCVDPDILIVDEALSVGDVAFKNKCMSRIMDLRAKGVTILFVSHDLSTLQMICDRAVWLEAGKVRAIGDPIPLTQDYHSLIVGGEMSSAAAPRIILPQQQTEWAEFVHFNLRRGNRSLFATGDDIEFEFALRAIKPIEGLIFAYSVYRGDGDWMMGQPSSDEKIIWGNLERNQIARGRLTLKSTVLGPGEYSAAFAAYSEDLQTCYGMTDLNIRFSVRNAWPTWGKIVHPCEWRKA